MTPCSWCARLHAPGPEHCLYGVVLVTGGRDYRDGHVVAVALDLVALRVEVAAIRHGGADGADRLADRWAEKRGVQRDPVRAHWDQHGQPRPPRNADMLALPPPPVLVVAFPGGDGTADMVKRTRRAGVPVWHPGADPVCAVMSDVVEAFREHVGRDLNDAKMGARVNAMLRDATKPHTDPEVVAAVRAAEVVALRVLQGMREVGR